MAVLLLRPISLRAADRPAPGGSRTAGQQRVQPPGVTQRGEVRVTAYVGEQSWVQRDRGRERLDGGVGKLRASLDAGQVIAGHPGGHGWRGQVAGEGDRVRLQRHAPVRLGMVEVVVPDVPHRVPETPDDDLQPELPTLQPGMAGWIEKIE